MMGSKLISSCIPMQLIVGGQKKSGLQESEVSSASEAGFRFAFKVKDRKEPAKTDFRMFY